MSAPTRLRDDPSAPDALRDDLRRAGDAEPSYDAERGLFALQAAVAATGSATSVGDAAGHAASEAQAAAGHAAVGHGTGGSIAAASGKLTLAAVATAVGLGVAGIATWMLAPAPRAERRAPVASHDLPEPAAPAVPAPMPAKPAASPSEPAEAPAVRHAPATPGASPTPRQATPGQAASDPDAALRREIDHLARVKALIERDPRAAYALAQAGNRTLSSMLRHERDGLSVLALEAAGEHARARRLGQQFLQRYPSSPLRERVAAIAASTAGAH